MDWQDAGTLAELPDGEPTAVRIGTQAFVLLRRGADVHAFEALCPHKFAPLAEGHLEGDCLVCPVHDAHFHMHGAPRDGDSWAGSLATFETRIESGQVQVRF